MQGMQSRDDGVQQEQAPGLYFCLQTPEPEDHWSCKRSPEITYAFV